jgi:hypothetical protein
MRDLFVILGTDRRPFNFSTLHETLHFSTDRRFRHLDILNKIGSGSLLCSFVVDKGHENGNEIHSIFSNGVIVIRNERTNRLITELIARPAQLKRYWELQGKPLPIEIAVMLPKAREYQIKGYNNL